MMKEKLRELRRMISANGDQDISIQRNTRLYFTSLVLVFFVVLIIFLTALGFFATANRDVSQMLEVQLSNSVMAIARQNETLAAHGITMSRQLGRIMDAYLHRTDETLEELNNNPAALLDIQRAVFEPLYSVLQMVDCNGVYFILDATVNTSLPDADKSRSALYIRFSSVKVNTSENINVALYRGHQSIARENGLLMHNAWELESYRYQNPYFTRILRAHYEQTSQTYYWSEKINLLGTWENVVLLEVPVVGSDGTVYGICGFEVNELLFQFSYPIVQTEIGPIITVLAPTSGGKLHVSRGLVGDLTSHLHGADSLSVKADGGFLSYTADNMAFVGKEQNIILSPFSFDHDNQWVVATLLPGEYYRAYYTRDQAVLIGSSVAFLLLLLLITRLLSRRYTRLVLLMSQKREQELMADNALLDRLNRMKNEFFQNMSHDFKTPLNVIQTSLYTVKDMFNFEIDEEQACTILDNAEEEVLRLARMVDGAMAYSSLYDNKQRMEPLDVAALLRDGAETYRALLERNGNGLTIDIPRSMPYIFGSTDMLLHVLSNLLSNANRHTRNGEITIQAIESAHIITIKVKDTGSGIKPELLPHIFERGVSDSGTGLGLAISKSAIEAHNGAISVESELGKGAIFTFTLPIYKERRKNEQ